MKIATRTATAAGVVGDWDADGAGDEDALEDGAGDEDALEDGAGDEDAREDGAGDEDLDGAGDEDARADGARDEDARADGARDEDAREDGARDEDARADGAGDDDADRLALEGTLGDDEVAAPLGLDRNIGRVTGDLLIDQTSHDRYGEKSADRPRHQQRSPPTALCTIFARVRPQPPCRPAPDFGFVPPAQPPGRNAVTSGPIPFEMAQRPAIAVPVTGLTEDRRRVLMRADRVIEPVCLRQRDAEIVQCHALAVPVTGLPEDRRRVPVRADRVIEPVRLPPARRRDCSSALPSPCRSPVSRKIAAASRCALIASSNRSASASARPRLSSATALAVPVTGLPEDRGRVLVRADRLLKPVHLPPARGRDCPAPLPSPCRSPVSR